MTKSKKKKKNIQEKNNTKAKFYIKRVSNVEEEDDLFLNEHEQFFQRLNYFLDIKKEWPRCISKDEKIIFRTYVLIWLVCLFQVLVKKIK